MKSLNKYICPFCRDTNGKGKVFFEENDDDHTECHECGNLKAYKAQDDIEVEKVLCDCRSVFKGTGKPRDHQMECTFKHRIEELEWESTKDLVAIGGLGG